MNNFDFEAIKKRQKEIDRLKTINAELLEACEEALYNLQPEYLQVAYNVLVKAIKKAKE